MTAREPAPRRGHALVVAPLLPEFDREGGSRRIFDLIVFLRESDWAVTFVAENGAAGDRYVRALQQRGVETYVAFNSSLEGLIGTGHFDLILVAFWYIAEKCLPLVRTLSPHTHVVVDTIDLHFLRTARHTFRHPDGELDEQYALETIRELNAYAAADAVLAVSEKEAEILSDLLGIADRALVLPLDEDVEPSAVPFQERGGLLFVGNFRHKPNVEAVEFLCSEIVPRLDPGTLAEHPLYVVGNGLDDHVRDLANRSPHVRMVGWVPSVLPYLQQARVSVAPLLHGAGTKTKVIQALMAGTPTVSTPIGVEGLNLRHGEHVLVAHDPAQFAAEVETLLKDRRLWQRLARRGRSHIQAVHGRDAVCVRFERIIGQVMAQPPMAARKNGEADASIDWTRPAPGPYRRLVRRIREAIRSVLPSKGAVVLVVSRGDEALVNLPGFQAWHFPRAEDGQYAGFYPADARVAIAHLEALRAVGGEYLVFPWTALWWLDHYQEFRQHLERSYRLVSRCENTCLVYALGGPELAVTPTDESTRERT